MTYTLIMTETRPADKVLYKAANTTVTNSTFDAYVAFVNAATVLESYTYHTRDKGTVGVSEFAFSDGGHAWEFKDALETNVSFMAMSDYNNANSITVAWHRVRS